MCRVLAYTGPQVIIEDLLYKPDSSLIRQAYAPQQLNMLNLGGFGMLAWDADSAQPSVPWSYRSTELPVFDNNLQALSSKACASCLLAHVRGIPYSTDGGFGQHNLHPFKYQGCRWAMAHNGDLYGHHHIKQALMQHVKPSIARQMRGTTDSETIYALVMSLLDGQPDKASPEQLLQALITSLDVIGEVRRSHHIERNSALNLFFTDGESILALRYTYDFGCYDSSDPQSIHESNLNYLSLWYTAGEFYNVVNNDYAMTGNPVRSDAFLLASEPLTRDVTGWVELAEYTALLVSGTGANRTIVTADMPI